MIQCRSRDSVNELFFCFCRKPDDRPWSHELQSYAFITNRYKLLILIELFFFPFLSSRPSNFILDGSLYSGRDDDQHVKGTAMMPQGLSGPDTDK